MEKKNLKAPKKLYIEKNPIPSHKYALLAIKPIKTEDKINLIQEVNFLSKNVLVKSKSTKRIKDKLSKIKPTAEGVSLEDILDRDIVMLNHAEVEACTTKINDIETIECEIEKLHENTSIFDVPTQAQENPEVSAIKNTKKKSKSKVKK